MYGGGILLVSADVKSHYGEHRLEQRYPDYADYRAHTRHRLIPYVW